MAKFRIKYALGGGFGGISNKDWEYIGCNSLKDAENWVYEAACDEYDSYAGMNGVLSYMDIVEENEDLNDEETWDIYCEEREGWLEYVAEEVFD
jgi:hypothetical protein